MVNKKENDDAPLKKLCLNCAWRATCAKRFSVSFANGEVICQDYSRDVSLNKK